MDELKVDYQLAINDQDQEVDHLESDINSSWKFNLRPRRVVAAKILELGLVSNSNVLNQSKYKRTKSKAKRHSSSFEEHSSGEDGEEEQLTLVNYFLLIKLLILFLNII